MSDIEHLKKDHSANGRIKTLILIVIIASLVWGMVGSIDLFIVSGLQGLFPTRTNFQYAILQIIIYLILIILVIYITDFDASSLFLANNSIVSTPLID